MKKILPVMLVTALAATSALQAQAQSDEIFNWHQKEGVMNQNLMGRATVGDLQSFPEYGSDEIFNWHEEKGVRYSNQGKVAYNSPVRREYNI